MYTDAFQSTNFKSMLEEDLLVVLSCCSMDIEFTTGTCKIINDCLAEPFAGNPLVCTIGLFVEWNIIATVALFSVNGIIPQNLQS